MEKQSPLLRLWELGKDYHGGLVGAICSASIGVLCGIIAAWLTDRITDQCHTLRLRKGKK